MAFENFRYTFEDASSSVNLASITDSSYAWYSLKRLLKACGWSIPRSSDGLTYNSSGDGISSSGSGAGGMNNASAWWVAQAPDGRQLCFQRTTNDRLVRLKYSAAAGFSAGSPSATRVPSATDEGVVVGSGTDASPTGRTVVTGASGGYLLHIAAETTAPYRVYLIGYSAYGGSMKVCFFYDATTPPAIGLTDADPRVLYFHDWDSNAWCGGIGSLGQQVKGWLKKGRSGEGFVAMAALQYRDDNGAGTLNLIVPSHLGADQINDKANLHPIFVARSDQSSAPRGLKGMLTMCRWRGTEHSLGEGLTVSSANDRISFNDLVLPFSGTAPTGTSGGIAAQDVAGKDGVAPTVTGVTPTNGSSLGATYAAAKVKTIEFTVADQYPGLEAVRIWCKLAGDLRTFLVHDGTDFKHPFLSSSRSGNDADGYDYDITISGGWTSVPTITVEAIDEDGNRTTTSLTWTLPTPTFTTSQDIKTQIEATIKAIDPLEEPDVTFHLPGQQMDDPEDVPIPSGAKREFFVFHGGGALGPYHHHEEFQAVEQFRVVLVYPQQADWRALDNLIRRDVHSIKTALDEPTNWHGNVLHQVVSSWEAPSHDDEDGRWLQTLLVTVDFLESFT